MPGRAGRSGPVPLVSPVPSRRQPCRTLRFALLRSSNLMLPCQRLLMSRPRIFRRAPRQRCPSGALRELRWTRRRGRSVFAVSAGVSFTARQHATRMVRQSVAAGPAVAVAIPEPPAAAVVQVAVAPTVRASSPAVQAPAPAAAPAPVKSTIQIKKHAPAPVVEAPEEVAPPQPKASNRRQSPRRSRPRTPAESSADDCGRRRSRRRRRRDRLPAQQALAGWPDSSPIIIDAACTCRPAGSGHVRARADAGQRRRTGCDHGPGRERRCRPKASAGGARRARRPEGHRLCHAATEHVARATECSRPVTPVKAAAAAPESCRGGCCSRTAARTRGRTRAEARAAGCAGRSVLRAAGRQRGPARGDARRTARPDELRGQLNEVVIVRVLVTQAGQPLMVNLLRKSKAGASLDDAIVAAVKQWTSCRPGNVVSP